MAAAVAMAVLLVNAQLSINIFWILWNERDEPIIPILLLNWEFVILIFYDWDIIKLHSLFDISIPSSLTNEDYD